MMAPIDYILDRITMYRLVLYVLISFIGMAAILAYFRLLPFSPLWLLGSSLFLVIMCWATNTAFAYTFKVPTNIESGPITALILALIISPAQSLTTFQFLGWAAILAMASKYILALNKKHLFNPAAIAVVITLFAVGDSASWWVGTASMLPIVLNWRLPGRTKNTSSGYGMVFLCDCVWKYMRAFGCARSVSHYRVESIVHPVTALFLCLHYAD